MLCAPPSSRSTRRRRASPGPSRSRCTSRPTTAGLLLCYEVYADDAGLARHQVSDAVRAAVSRFGELLDGNPEVTYARLLSGKGVPFA